jgi:hypothetical protein
MIAAAINSQIGKSDQSEAECKQVPRTIVEWIDGNTKDLRNTARMK